MLILHLQTGYSVKNTVLWDMMPCRLIEIHSSEKSAVSIFYSEDRAAVSPEMLLYFCMLLHGSPQMSLKILQFFTAVQTVKLTSYKCMRSQL